MAICTYLLCAVCSACLLAGFLLFATGYVYTSFVTTLFLMTLHFSVRILARLRFYENSFILPPCTEASISVAALHRRPSASPSSTSPSMFCFASTTTNFYLYYSFCTFYLLLYSVLLCSFIIHTWILVSVATLPNFF